MKTTAMDKSKEVKHNEDNKTNTQVPKRMF